MKKILRILSAIALTSTASANIIACGKGENPTPPTPHTKVDLSIVITEKDLGQITMIGNEPSKAELLTAIKINNEAAKDLNENDFDFQGAPTATTVTIIGANGNQGKVDLTYQKDLEVDLSIVITEKDLGQITMIGNEPSKAELLTAIKINNEAAKDLNENDFDFQGAPTATTVTIIGANGNQGKVDLTYQKDTRVDLSNLPTTANVTLLNTTKSVAEYQKALINQLTIGIFSTLSLNDVEITKTDGGILQDGDINAGLLNTKITAKATSTNFKNDQSVMIKIATKNQIINLGSRAYQLQLKNNDLYVGTYANIIYKVDITTNQKTEIIDLHSQVFGLVFNGNDLYAGTQSGKIYKIDINNTKDKTEIADLGSWVNCLVLHGNDLYAGTSGGQIYKIDINNTKDKTEIIDLHSQVFGLVFNGNDLYAGINDKKIYKINITTKDKSELIDLGSRVDSLVLKDNLLYVGTHANKIYTVDITTKEQNEIADLDSWVYGLLFNGNDLYAGTYDGQIYKVDF